MPVARRPATELEQDAIAALQQCSLTPATSKKRFIMGFRSPVTELSDREANYALFLCYHFRRQIPRDLMNRVWDEWFHHPDRLNGYRTTGELQRFMWHTSDHTGVAQKRIFDVA